MIRIFKITIKKVNTVRRCECRCVCGVCLREREREREITSTKKFLIKHKNRIIAFAYVTRVLSRYV